MCTLRKMSKIKQTLANNFDTIQPRFRILHCLEYGKYGITPTIDRADEVLHAYAIIRSSIMLLLTSLLTTREDSCVKLTVQTMSKNMNHSASRCVYFVPV